MNLFFYFNQDTAIFHCSTKTGTKYEQALVFVHVTKEDIPHSRHNSLIQRETRTSVSTWTKNSSQSEITPVLDIKPQRSCEITPVLDIKHTKILFCARYQTTKILFERLIRCTVC
ncbi:hypothetical protein DPMN_076788 [Dreissena polymorpha]|uniref:Uncharacterized protein n=1 Tax=Dreissena polymorpha TaxID=45954 RepID=A0A9D4BQT2_DREPO|nr:hypothetical protein DPMN_076788 [Dreissena polymorpha]